MTRRSTNQRLARTLPVVVAALGAGVMAVLKRRAARHTRHEFADIAGADFHTIAAPVTPLGHGKPAPPVETTLVAVIEEEVALVDVAPAREAPTRGATKSAVLAALAKGEAMTATEVALATGLQRPTVSSTLSRLARAGEIAKAERGYQLAAAPAPKKRAARPKRA